MQKHLNKATVRDNCDEAEVSPPRSNKGEALKSEIDDLLDDIEDVLEENAAVFLKNYVQAGGE
jgi:ubiquitin-like protein Pup